MATVLRAAIYCRKSSEEGLEQDFNSLDAQREACEAYIASQRHQGWQPMTQHFDDGGYSGGTLDRPALQALIGGVRRRQVDVIVVYKVDRLTRSLADFAKLVEVLDAHSVSFVSVTQQFNTTNSMGRLTLNVLLSFAQFEREVTGERIRDKIAASKRKGMWMGGTAPLGYQAQDRQLVIDEAEARVVRRLFALYVETGCVRAVQHAARRERLTTRAGHAFSRGPLYHLLKNPIYRGEVRHRETTHPGLHPALIDEATWAAAQRRLAEHRLRPYTRRADREPHLLVGRLFGPDQVPYTTNHAVKAAKRYRYYVETRGDSQKLPGRRRQRIAAAEIETLIIEALAAHVRDLSVLRESLLIDDITPEALRRLSEQATELSRQLQTGAEGRAAFQAIVQRVRLLPEQVTAELSINGLRQTLGLPLLPQSTAAAYPLTINGQLRRRGMETKFIITGPTAARTPRPDPSLIKLIVRAHDWWRLWRTGTETLASIAKAHGCTDRYVARVVALAFMAPDLTADILEGRHSPALSAEDLLKQWLLPPDWADQRRLLG